MKHFLSLFVALLVAVATVSASAATDAQRQLVKVGEFTQLNVADNINVDYVCNADSSGLAVFTADSKMVSSVMFTNNDKGKLTIQVALDTPTKGMPTVTVYSTSLQEAKNQGDSTLRLVSLAKSPKLKLVTTNNGRIVAHGIDVISADLNIATGHGKIITDGTCKSLKVKCVGAGEVQADKLTAVDVSCSVVGTGTVGCMVDGGALKVTGSGTGRVYYKGKPSDVTVRKLGTLKAIPLD